MSGTSKTCDLRRIAAAIAGALLFACGGEPPAAPAGARPVRVLVVPDPTDAAIAAYPGRAEAAQEVNLNFRVPGRMLERNVELGDRVRAGQVIAQLDLRDFRAALDRALAEREQASTRLVRVREAAETGAVSRQEVSEAEARAESASAAVEIGRKALEDATLRAPFDGSVAATYREPLQQVKAGEPIVRLLDTSNIEMWVNVPEDRIDRATADLTLTVRFDALPGREFAAEILEIGSEADEETRTYPVSVRILQPEGGEARVLPGMAGEVLPKLPAGTDSTGPEVPLSAVFSDVKSPSYVWIVEADGNTVKRRDVETGRLTDRGIVVREGLRPGERIVSQGGHLLSEGVEVRVVESSGSAS